MIIFLATFIHIAAMVCKIFVIGNLLGLCILTAFKWYTICLFLYKESNNFNKKVFGKTAVFETHFSVSLRMSFGVSLTLSHR